MGVRAWAACAAPVLILAVAPAAHALPACNGARWVGAWSANPSDSAHDGFAGQTLREIVTPHLGGTQLRVHLTNRFGQAPVTFDAVTVALRRGGAALVEHTSQPITFDRRRSVTIPAGADAVSDPVGFAFKPFQDLAISLYSSSSTGPPTEHFIARQTSYVTKGAAGDHTGDAGAAAFGDALSSWFFLSGVDAMATAATGVVATFGDSITDGFQGDLLPVVVEKRDGFDQNARYPDHLARRLLAAGIPLSVLNDGITGNRLVQDGFLPQFGPSAVSRLDADVLAQAGVTTAIVLEGINDIGDAEPPGGVTAAQLIDAYRQLIARLRARGIRVLMGTLTPSGNSPFNGYSTTEANATREQVNAWIRTGGGADGVVDFDAALRDPHDPRLFAPQYDSGDHLHPSLAGYKRMAEVVDLTTLARPRCVPPRKPRTRHRRHRRHHRLGR